MLCIKRFSGFFFLNVVAVFFLFVASGWAAPKILNYQGTLQDNGGNPVNAAKTMSFKIYDVVSEGTALWNSGNLQVPVVNGVFSVTLDGEDANNPFPDDLFSKEKLYIGISVDGTEFIDRKRLASVPYALNAASASAGIPYGVIVMWHGSADEVPEGWALCDGKNDITPDLRDRFIVGAGKSYTEKATGGMDQNPPHKHSIANDSITHSHPIGSHTHGFSGITSVNGEHRHCNTQASGCNHGFSEGGSRPSGTDGDHQHTFSGTSSPASGNTSTTSISHNHGGFTGNPDTTLENRPPYYALCFIMKL